MPRPNEPSRARVYAQRARPSVLWILEAIRLVPNSRDGCHWSPTPFSRVTQLQRRRVFRRTAVHSFQEVTRENTDVFPGISEVRSAV